MIGHGEQLPESSTTRFCYVVLCHRDAAQVLGLVRRIRELSATATVLVRHDRGPGFLDEPAVTAAGGLLLPDPYPVRWGGWSMVQASLRAFAHARAVLDPDWLVLISGQDWPATDLASWETEVAGSGADAVVSGAPVDLTFSPGGPLSRITEADLMRARWTHRWTPLPRVRALDRVPARLRRGLNAAFVATVMWHQRPVMLRALPRGLGWLVGVRRGGTGLPEQWQIVKGEQWLAVSRRAMDGVRATVRADPGIVAFFATTHIPDESFLQTLLHNDPGLSVRPGPVSFHRFAGPAASPDALTHVDVPAALASGAPFARKIDVDVDATVAGLLDAAVDATLTVPPPLGRGPGPAGARRGAAGE